MSNHKAHILKITLLSLSVSEAESADTADYVTRS